MQEQGGISTIVFSELSCLDGFLLLSLKRYVGTALAMSLLLSLNVLLARRFPAFSRYSLYNLGQMKNKEVIILSVAAPLFFAILLTFFERSLVSVATTDLKISVVGCRCATPYHLSYDRAAASLEYQARRDRSEFSDYLVVSQAGLPDTFIRLSDESILPELLEWAPGPLADYAARLRSDGHTVPAALQSL